jgi:hypothetical protein
VNRETKAIVLPAEALPGMRMTRWQAPARALKPDLRISSVRDISAVAQRIGVIGGSGFIGTSLGGLLLTLDQAVRIIDANPSQIDDYRAMLLCGEDTLAPRVARARPSLSARGPIHVVASGRPVLASR